VFSARIALDAMGGDFYALPNLQGAYWAIKKSQALGKNIQVFLVGPEDRVLGKLREAVDDPAVPSDFRINEAEFQKFLKAGFLVPVPSTQVVEMDDSPALAVRTKKDSSLARAYHLVKSGQADAMISAGNSGAVMAYGIALLGRLPEVRRPAILCTMPAKGGFCSILDAGANVDCTAEHLVQFATMGMIYSQAVFNKAQPRVALMNIGEEEGKGNELTKETHERLKASFGPCYVGFAEGRDVFNGKVDVIVCDGFVGNVLLKTAEGVAKMVKETLKEELSRNPIRALGALMARGGFTALKSRMDYREYGAAPLIGLNGLGMVAHGSSDGKAITSSILLATLYVEGGLMPKLREAFGAKDSESSKEGAGL